MFIYIKKSNANITVTNIIMQDEKLGLQLEFCDVIRFEQQ